MMEGTVSATSVGRKAEAAARVYLEMRGFKIIEQNWRRPYCEIDLIVIKDDVVHLVEVKYRHDDQQGGGIEAITPSKLRHMRRAADGWAEETKWRGEYILSAIELGGDNFMVLSFVENVF
jgi:putative endonuclease